MTVKELIEALQTHGSPDAKVCVWADKTLCAQVDGATWVVFAQLPYEGNE